MKAIKRLVALLVASAMLVVPVMASDVAWNTSDPIDWYYGDGASDVTVGAVESPTDAPVLVTFTIESTGKSYKEYEEGKVKLTDVNDDSHKVTIAKKVTYNGMKYLIRAIAKNAFKGAEDITTINFRSKARIKLGAGLFDDLDTTKVTINVNKKMPDDKFELFQARILELGFKGKILHSLDA